MPIDPFEERGNEDNEGAGAGLRSSDHPITDRDRPFVSFVSFCSNRYGGLGPAIPNPFEQGGILLRRTSGGQDGENGARADGGERSRTPYRGRSALRCLRYLFVQMVWGLGHLPKAIRFEQGGNGENGGGMAASHGVHGVGPLHVS